MQQFSHSKLQIYERCPLQYKFQYIEKPPTERVDTVEAFMGSCVHNTLELLYRDLIKTKLNTLDELLVFYDDTWRASWTKDVVINNKTFKKSHYFNLGKKCVQNYYDKYYPFDQDQTIGVEKEVFLKWGDYTIIGYIDRLSREKNGVYAIHDYKTGSIMTQDYADKDRQLALYSIAVKRNFKEAKIVKLVWHFVAYGETIISTRSDEELTYLKNDILELIKEINVAEEKDIFPAQETMCDWCNFWKYCPKKKHLFKIKKLPKNKYLNDSGVKLANKYIELAKQRSLINKQAKTEATLVDVEKEKVEQAILKYAKKHQVETLHGNDSRIVINKTTNYSFPARSVDLERYSKLENLLKETKYWDDVSSINASRLEQLLTKNDFEDKLKNKIIKLAPVEERVRLSIKKNE
ncbi:PD-(D/E)XK nuclease family protein [Patescibacteria group bacterium]|nr:PD-(D/E)XK nuclease family protein [Patescibacteria group bacterium]MBU1922534.1 PD-(D/E)XK nuclease family protein [Patescibacteria group bacterium]